VATFDSPKMFDQHQVTGEFTMNRSVCKLGLAAALVLGALAFGAAPAQAQDYVMASPAPATVYSYNCAPTYYYYPAYTSCYCTPTCHHPGYVSYYYVPTYRYHQSCCGWSWRACGCRSWCFRW
jgi:hypothetical protein